jgi:hypothetical protein
MDAMATKREEFRHMEAIVQSVLDSDATDRLAAYTSMHDLIVIGLPIPEPPYGVVAVRAPGSLHPPRDGHVLIEEMSVTGHDDNIERSVAEAVPLFWRFMIEKYGVPPSGLERTHVPLLECGVAHRKSRMESLTSGWRAQHFKRRRAS